ncbi:hypothetical protein D1872_180460 [compost metagenome]
MMSEYLIVKTSTSIIKVTPSYVIITQKIGSGELKIPIESIVHVVFKSTGLGLGKIEFQHTGKNTISSGVSSNIVRFVNSHEERGLRNVKKIVELYKTKNYEKNEINQIIIQNKELEEAGKKNISKNQKVFGGILLFFILAGLLGVYNLENSRNYTPTYTNDSSDGTSSYSNYPASNTSPYTRQELEADPTAPSKDPRDYNSNGEYVPHDGPSNDPADYNMYGEYRPIENMTPEEIQTEAVEMMKKNGVGR